ncbi:hypothetical protein LTR36_009972 [Oleoguttula mirabilis]|uniref:Uncharacterized protein n=1 Tax=Oleoguttula mirabilis TaxID=1507867 RepID=A0AAV9J4P3_9PEZI|nr:hypothetical protein LTR36_009972 [Oleoguttula mirabilis]
MPSDTDVYTPSNDEVLAAVRDIRSTNPSLGHRLKRLMVVHNLYRIPEQAADADADANLPAINYPDDALAAQQKYKDESTRCFELYSRHPTYDFAVSPNADMAIVIGVRTLSS